MISTVNFFRDFFGLENATFSRVDHNDTMVAIVYKVNIPFEKSLILKICTRDKDFHRELYFLNSLSGILPVLKVEKIAEPVEGRVGAILMECLKGDLIREGDWTFELSYDIGVKLALVHTKRVNTYGDFTQNDSSNHNAREYFSKKFFEELE